MTYEEAAKILQEADGYIGDGQAFGDITLDGQFSIEELEALFVYETHEREVKS